MTARNEGYKIMPPMDKEKYPELPGLEGPFTTLSNKVVYYDPKEGAYYDKDTDMYMSYDEFRALDNDYSGMKDERDDVKEVDKTSIDNAVRQALGGAPATSPRPKARPKNLPRPKPRPKMIGSNPKTGSTRGIDPRDNYSPEDLKRLLMQSAYARMDEGARGLGSIDWPDVDEDGDSAMAQHAENAIRHGMHAYDAYDHVYSMSRERDWLSDNKDMIIDMFAQYGLQTESAEKRWKQTSMSPKEAIAKYGKENVRVKKGALRNGDDMVEVYVESINEWGGDDQYQAVEGFIENALGMFDDMLDKGIDELRARAEAHDYLKGELGDLGVRHGDYESKEYHGELEKEIIQIMNRRDKGMGEGHSPHKKGTAKYKKHMAAMHAGMNEGEEKPYICVHAKKGKHECRAESSYAAAKKAAAHWGLKSTAGIDAHLAIDEAQVPANKPKVSVNEMQDALKLKDAPSNEHVVASYVRTMIDESHKTWDDVMEQVEFVLDLVKEGKTMKAEDVFNIVKSQHMQSYFDYKMSLKENLNTLRNIVKDKAYQTVKFEDGSMKVDLTTASMFLQVFDAQKPETQEKIQAKIKTKQGFLAMLDLIYSKM